MVVAAPWPGRGPSAMWCRGPCAARPASGKKPIGGGGPPDNEIIAPDMTAACPSMSWVFGVRQDADSTQLGAVFNLALQLAAGRPVEESKTIAEASCR